MIAYIILTSCIIWCRMMNYCPFIKIPPGLVIRLAATSKVRYVGYHTEPGPAHRRGDRRMAPAFRASVMQPATIQSFDPLQFLARVGKGKTLIKVPARGPVFAQGDPADAAFYILKGRIELRVA